MAHNTEDLVIGKVVEALPNALFRIELQSNNEVIIGYLAGKMRIHRIKVIVGDRVTVLPDPYGGKARIVKRG